MKKFKVEKQEVIIVSWDDVLDDDEIQQGLASLIQEIFEMEQEVELAVKPGDEDNLGMYDTMTLIEPMYPASMEVFNSQVKNGSPIKIHEIAYLIKYLITQKQLEEGLYLVQF